MSEGKRQEYKRRTCCGRRVYPGNTPIGAILTNASLTKADATKIASISEDGIARTTRPSHTFLDGDTLFTMSAGIIYANVNVIGILAVKAVENAIIRAVLQTESAYGLPAASSL